MNFPSIVFFVLATVLVLSALRVITARNPVHAALFLVLAFASAAGLWLLLHAEFLAITLILVYVGAVMVLFLFVIMMLDINVDRLREGFWNILPIALPVAVLLLGIMGATLMGPYFGLEMRPPPPEVAEGYSNTRAIGMVLYTEYLYPFELAAVILLVAIIAAIALTLRARKNTRSIDPAVQVAATREGRVRLVSMPSEKKGVSAPAPEPEPPQQAPQQPK
ncbi:MAG: NADH-quinone oxidoreductase subunit J [bacterium]|jgi:NADH-quinone oxidoreductase subunit J|nr:NADH-quinone oxidoreductase subunit J [Rubrivivax sp.]MCE2946967.1 NADH-quinone oxidoreductase subunit J [Betaproteobacteria bacterium]